MQANYFKVPNAIFSALIDKYEKLVVIYLCRCQNNSKSAFPSYNTVARNCGISRRKAILTIDSLLRKEFIVKELRSTNSTNKYIVLLDKFGSACGAPLSAEYAPNKELLIKNINNNNGHFLQEEMPIPIRDEIKETIKYYFQAYKRKTKHDHPHLKSQQYKRVAEEIGAFARELDFDKVKLKKIINGHFKRKIKTDFNINHFATPEILQNLFYTEIY